MDETLDVLAAHGVAGFTGILFIGFFAQADWNGDLATASSTASPRCSGDQALAALVAPLYAFTATFILLRLMAFGFRLRVTEREEAIGLDVTQHGEEAYVTRRGRDPRRAGRRARPRPVRGETRF